MTPDHKIDVKLDSRSESYCVSIGAKVLNLTGSWARASMQGKSKRVVLMSNSKVFGLYGDVVVESLNGAGFEVAIWLMEDGEEFKNFDSLNAALAFFSENRLTRSDSVIALGGGVIGDLAGFAAAVYMRGLAFLQIPTTLLAMIDASVGGKTGINLDSGKNLVGSFHQPRGVLVDVSTLRTLETREIIAGFCEAIKHGVIGGRKLLDLSADFLKNYSTDKFSELFDNADFLSRLKQLISANIDFKAQIVMADAIEAAGRRDSHSRKILNFGHTVAHALEKVTEYRYFKHGEAVGYGILAAAEISKRLDILDKDSLELLNGVVASAGRLPNAEGIDIQEVENAFLYDKKMDGNSLDWILINDIGSPIIVDNHQISRLIIKESLEKIFSKQSS